MKNIVLLFITPLLYIVTCNAQVNKADKGAFKDFINCVTDGDDSCLKETPKYAWRLNFEQSISLRDALAHSLIKSPESTIDTLKIIDKETSQRGHSAIIDNYGTDIVCSYMIDSNKYSKESFFKYYSIAKSKLEKTGDKGKTCLDIMNSSVEETIYEEKMGKMKWGSEKYNF